MKMGIETGDGDLKKEKTNFLKYIYYIHYDRYYENNFRNDVERAVKFCLTCEDNTLCNFNMDMESGEATETRTAIGFILYPQALNPFLKIMETLKLNNKIIILPAYNQEDGINSPAYLIIRLPNGYPIKIVTQNN